MLKVFDLDSLSEFKGLFIAIGTWCLQSVIGGMLALYINVYATEDNIIMLKLVREGLAVVAGVITIVALSVYVYKQLVETAYIKQKHKNSKGDK